MRLRETGKTLRDEEMPNRARHAPYSTVLPGRWTSASAPDRSASAFCATSSAVRSSTSFNPAGLTVGLK